MWIYGKDCPLDCLIVSRLHFQYVLLNSNLHGYGWWTCVCVCSIIWSDHDQSTSDECIFNFYFPHFIENTENIIFNCSWTKHEWNWINQHCILHWERARGNTCTYVYIQRMLFWFHIASQKCAVANEKAAKKRLGYELIVVRDYRMSTIFAIRTYIFHIFYRCV